METPRLKYVECTPRNQEWRTRLTDEGALASVHISINPSNGTGVTKSCLFTNGHLPHEILVYPPKIYLPTLIIVTVGPLLSHREWNVLAAQPSTDARQQRFQRELTLFVTGASQLLNEVKWFLLFPTITESCKPGEKNSTFAIWQKNSVGAKYNCLKIQHQMNPLTSVTLRVTIG